MVLRHQTPATSLETRPRLPFNPSELSHHLKIVLALTAKLSHTCTWPGAACHYGFLWSLAPRSSCFLLLELILLLQVSLTTLMFTIYCYKLSLIADSKCGNNKVRPMHFERRSSSHAMSSMSGDQVLQANDFSKKSHPSFFLSVHKPSFLPEFHGFEMFVWSVLKISGW